ncbi:MAG: tripartite tricarboxylate transporter substrate binding protein [Betaproteobacteria bacterium]|nr:tripartite tricarboxylate transporter substrate binding protein [Betaproteobacteria bacterium]
MIARLAGIVSATISLALGFSPGAWAQGWKPERNVELIVPASAGGSLDTTGRTVQKLWDELKLVPVSSTIVNRSGGGHAVAYNFLNQRAGDPHYLSITSSTLHTSHINGRTPLSYRDFTPLTVLLTEYIAFAVRADSPIKSGKDLIETLRKDPGALSLALSSARGGTHHISFGLPLQSASVDMKQSKLVAFNSTGEAVTALLGGHVDVMSGGTVQIAPHVESGKMRVLAVSSAKRLPGPLSVAPTWPELGYKGVFDNWRGVIGTKGMSADQTAFWESVFRKVIESDEFRKLTEKNQWDANFKSAAETRRFMESQYNELKEVMTFLGLAK